ncbi:MAG: hypothetical protein DMG14_03675 [Acidobacteria bacterium]|nr:MAG: hypothetical protein DMG14_03675 [Acidobacteriota bacterium]
MPQTAPNQPPVVSLTSPANGSTFTAPASITVSASASDPDGIVTKVEFFQGSTLIGTDTAAPYSVVWSGVPVGSYTLTARATDNAAASGTSAAVAITIVPDTTSPTAAITAPANGAEVSRRSTVTVTVSASDNIGVTQVSLYVNGALLASKTASPYTFTWDVPAKPGATYQLQAKAQDAAGNLGTSAVSTVTASRWKPP